MSANTERALKASFPRVVKNTEEGGNLGRGIFAGIFDAASLPGRGYASLWNRYNEPILEGMARTGENSDLPIVLRVADGLIRDPLTVLSAPVGGLAGSGGRAMAARTASAFAQRALPVAADATANTGLSALAQYGTDGRVDPGALAANAGFGLGMQGTGSVIAKMAPKAKRFWSSDQNAAAIERYGSKEDAKEILDRLNSWMEKGKKYKAIPAGEIGYLSADELDELLPPINSVEARFWKAGYEGNDPPILARGWRYGKPGNPNASWNFQDQKAEPGVSAMQAFTDDNPNVLGGTYEAFNKINDKRTIEGWLDRGAKGSDGEPLFTGVRDLGEYPHPDPNFQYLAGGQSPIAGANALAGKYVRGVSNEQEEDPMKGQDLGADWGNDAVPVGGDLGADWGNDPQTARRKPPERAPVADTAQQRTAQAVASFMAQKPTKPEERAQAAAGQPLASGYDGAMQALFPRSFAQIGEEGGADFWTGLKDAWSLPGRAGVAGVGALADLAGSAAASIPRELRGEVDPVASGDEALGSAWDTFRRELADPSGLMGGNAPGVSNTVAGIVKDPLLPLLTAAMPATGAGMFAGLGKAALFARAGASAAEATPLVLGAQAMEKAGTGEEFNLPKEAALAFGLGFAPSAAGEVLPEVAPWLRKVADERFTAGIKPRQRTGKEAEGLQKFLDAGGLPKVAGLANLQWNRPASRFFQILDEKAGPEYQRALAAADATAAAAPGTSGMVPKGKMAAGAEQGILDFATERPGAFTAQDMAEARRDVFDRLSMAGADPDAARKIAFGTGSGKAAVPTHLMPSEAQRLKSGLAADAFKRKEMSKAVEAAEEGAASSARQILGQKYPEIAALNEAWSPWYAARQAMETARQRGANRGFFTNLRNFPESPGFARGAYEASRAARAAGPVLQAFNPFAIPTLQVVNQGR